MQIQRIRVQSPKQRMQDDPSCLDATTFVYAWRSAGYLDMNPTSREHQPFDDTGTGDAVTRSSSWAEAAQLQWMPQEPHIHRP